MTPYFLLFIVLLFLSIVELNGRVLGNMVKVFLVILLVGLSGFRYEIGNDYNNYVLIFEQIEGYARIELGYMGLINLVKFLGGNVQAMFMLSAILAIVPLAYVINKAFPKYFCVAITAYVFTYIYFEGMNTVRQAISMTIMFYAFYDYLTNKKIWKYVALAFLASSIHYSVIIVALIAWLVLRFSGKNINTVAFVVVLIASFILGYYITSFTNQIVGAAVLMGRGDSVYLDNIEQRGVNSGMFHYVLNLYAIAFLIFAHAKSKYMSEFENGILKLFIVAIIIYNLFINFYIGLRLYWYFYLLITLAIPIVLSHINKKSCALVFVVIISVFVAYTYLSLGSMYYSPYKYTFDLIAK